MCTRIETAPVKIYQQRPTNRAWRDGGTGFAALSSAKSPPSNPCACSPSGPSGTPLAPSAASPPDLTGLSPHLSLLTPDLVHACRPRTPTCALTFRLSEGTASLQPSAKNAEKKADLRSASRQAFRPVVDALAARGALGLLASSKGRRESACSSLGDGLSSFSKRASPRGPSARGHVKRHSGTFNFFVK